MDMKLLESRCDELIDEMIDSLSDDDLQYMITTISVGDYSIMNKKAFNDLYEINHEEIDKFILLSPDYRNARADANCWYVMSLNALQRMKASAYNAGLLLDKMKNAQPEDARYCTDEALLASLSIWYGRKTLPSRKELLALLRARLSLRRADNV